MHVLHLDTFIALQFAVNAKKSSVSESAPQEVVDVPDYLQPPSPPPVSKHRPHFILFYTLLLLYILAISRFAQATPRKKWVHMESLGAICKTGMIKHKFC